MLGNFIELPKPRTIGCTVDIENTSEFLHAHVVLDGYEPGPGDEVIVHDAPSGVPFGERGTFRCRATVIPASGLGYLLSVAAGYLELTELYEVGFDGGSAA